MFAGFAEILACRRSGSDRACGSSPTTLWRGLRSAGTSLGAAAADKLDHALEDRCGEVNVGQANHSPSGQRCLKILVHVGDEAGKAVYNNAASVPAIVDSAGGLSPYRTMGQGGNVREWSESAFDGTTNSTSEDRALRGGFWFNTEDDLRSSSRTFNVPTVEGYFIGFRVASIPEPSTYALLLMTGAGALWLAKRSR
jgi:hypothetical protein